MNLIQLAMQKVWGKGQSEAAATRRLKRSRLFDFTRHATPDLCSRQTVRAQLRRDAEAYALNLKLADGKTPMPRKTRRHLARERAKSLWRQGVGRESIQG